MKSILYASRSQEITDRERTNYALSRRICAEGIVLLENDGSLPIKSDNVALYGAGARHTAFGGTGSGENNPRYSTTPEDGIKAASIKITTEDWLNEYDLLYKKAFTDYRINLKKGLKKVPIAEQMDYTADNPFYAPAGRILKEDESVSSDTAIYVLTRQSGEGADRKDCPGDYYATEDEKALMLSITKLYKHSVLVLNAGAVIDLSFLDNIKFSAVVLLMQGGMETGNALADILTGKVNPSGRLADTWGYSYNDYPSSDTFSERNPEKYQEDYKEGIFVGYRWFDKKGIKSRYPFGHGLSYTTFRTEYVSANITGTNVEITTSVTNTGKVSGREVVMLYLSCPENKLIREVKSLAAFAKTPLLHEGASCEITLSLNLADFAAFDENSLSFILEKGDYYIHLNAVPAIKLYLASDVITEKVKSMITLNRKFDYHIDFKSDRCDLSLPVFEINASSIKTITHDYSIPSMEKSEKIDDIVSKLSIKEMADILVGRSYFGPFRHRVIGAVGFTTSRLYKKGIDGMAMADGPQGINLTKMSNKPKNNFFQIPTLPSALRDVYAILKILSPKAKPTGKNLYYQFCTSWPSETLIAQTWDVDLVRQQGEAIAKEMKEYGVVFLLAPALNIHRNPLCGRNYEYYSEDPLLTGLIAAAVVKGVQSESGCFATLKHFAANNLETKRNLSSSNVDERTMREIYLKAFRIAIRESNARSVMCSYNKLNGIYTALDYNLQTGILRNEWGFRDIVMTDWFATGHDESFDEHACKAGTDLIMPGTPLIRSKILKAYKRGEISASDIERSARRIIKLALESHTAGNQ